MPPRTAVFHSPLSLLHNPPYEILSGALQPYVESPDRYHIILDALFPKDTASGTEYPQGAPETAFEEFALDWKRDEVMQPEWVLAAFRAVHSEEYLQFLQDIYSEWIAEGGSKAAVLPETFLRQDLLLEADQGLEKKAGAIEKAGRFSFDLSCPITADTWISAAASARVALEAAQHLLRSPDSPVFALCRPPGHHSTPSLCGGYCYLSNAAIASRFLQARSAAPTPSKVAILDIDYHHGNGTSKAMYSDPSVLYVSLHGRPDYPYFTGASTERGHGAGLGTNINYPLPLGTDDTGYLSTLGEAVSEIRRWKPEFLVVSLGVDTYIDDPLTEFKLTLDAYPAIGEHIKRVRVPTLFLMEGGYCLPMLGKCVKGVLGGFASD